MVEKVLLIGPRGFCAGVDRAVNTVEEALAAFGAPIYVKHEIVHNKTVCDALRSKGAIFVEEVSEIPEGSICIFSAHGIAPKVREQAKSRNLTTIDATCPLVTKIHIEVERFAREGKEIIYIGHRGHPEAVGVMGIRPDITQIVETPDEVAKLNPKDPDKLVYLTQTTLSIDECRAVIAALKGRFKGIKAPPSDDICYATTNRQAAIKQAAKQCDIILVVGSRNSSNSNRLVDTAKMAGIDAYLIDNGSEIKEEWLEGKKVLGISAGASAPEHIVQEMADRFRNEGAAVQELEVIRENMKFTMPYELYRVQEKG
ncbi:MAG: 4-hydroxy-3-methylbut-2-enyl diphosphate reductase [Candidatus Micrarchaeota archaeon]|nr:4-hydroxy-3-methylbut-2-enyl diphosphate reductase [Candidatus Micrarchaeota archaeon]